MCCIFIISTSSYASQREGKCVYGSDDQIKYLNTLYVYMYNDKLIYCLRSSSIDEKGELIFFSSSS